METPNPGTPIIVDIGSAYVKVGYAGEGEPRHVFPTIIGREKYRTVMVDVDTRQLYVGDDAMKMRGVLKLSHPIERSQIMEWDEYYEILNHIFYNLLRIESLSAYPVFYVDKLFVSKEIKEYIARVLFETHRAQSIIMIPSPILSCFSVGLTTGLVIESGDGETWVVPIINGQIIEQAVERISLAGMDVSHNLKSLLMREGINITSSAIDEIVREIKENHCFFVLDPNNPPKIDDQYSYTMPDGSTVSIPNHVLYEAPEVLFEPQMIGSNTKNITQAVLSSIQKVDKRYWGDMITHIALSGGNFMHSGFEERLKIELANALPQLGQIRKPYFKEEEVEQKKELQPAQINNKTKDTCPKCGALVDLSDGKTVCPECGAEMSITQLNIDVNNNSQDLEDEIPEVCPSCGKDINDRTSLFCPYCGEKLIQEEEEPQKPSSPPPAKEFFENSENILKFFVPDNLQYAIFTGAAILGSLPSFQQLFITEDIFQSNPDILYRDISQIFEK
ncbi:MAG: putative Actin/actin family protein [Promethearchaeota archaeon]|nr:MAG: putative Actin/actin family protein [Candidatus Lokiarchaeota archaeon]